MGFLNSTNRSFSRNLLATLSDCSAYLRAELVVIVGTAIALAARHARLAQTLSI